jgi:hypothetical protein
VGAENGGERREDDGDPQPGPNDVVGDLLRGLLLLGPGRNGLQHLQEGGGDQQQAVEEEETEQVQDAQREPRPEGGPDLSVVGRALLQRGRGHRTEPSLHFSPGRVATW